MKVTKINPRGYCHGVVNALNVVSSTINNPDTVKPIYILGEIVHNRNVTKSLAEAGAITLTGDSRQNLLSQVKSGTVIITAHGISPHLISKALEKGLNVVDATCRDVYKTHDIIREKLSDGYDVFYIGKKNHPETEGCISIDENIKLITSVKDVENMKSSSTKICVTNQTTLSIWDMQLIIDAIKNKYENVEIINEICDATELRQRAVANMDKDIDLLYVVGDKNSNNTNKLAEISEQVANVKAIRIDDSRDIDINDLKNVKNVAITSGASTPTLITKNVIDFLEQFEISDINTHDNYGTIDLTRILPRRK